MQGFLFLFSAKFLPPPGLCPGKPNYQVQEISSFRTFLFTVFLLFKHQIFAVANKHALLYIFLFFFTYSIVFFFFWLEIFSKIASSNLSGKLEICIFFFKITLFLSQKWMNEYLGNYIIIYEKKNFFQNIYIFFFFFFKGKGGRILKKKEK